MQFPREIFAAAGLNATDVALLVGVSKVTGFRWMRDGPPAGVNLFLRDQVSHVAGEVNRATGAGRLPLTGDVRRSVAERIAAIRKAINQQHTAA